MGRETSLYISVNEASTKLGSTSVDVVSVHPSLHTVESTIPQVKVVLMVFSHNKASFPTGSSLINALIKCPLVLKCNKIVDFFVQLVYHN